MGCIELQYGTQKHQNNPVVVHILQIDQEIETEEIGIIRQHHQACQQKQHIADDHDTAKAAHSDIGSVITLLHLHRSIQKCTGGKGISRPRLQKKAGTSANHHQHTTC